MFEVRIRLAAAWMGAEVDVHIGQHVQIGRRIRIVIEPGSTSSLHVADYCELDDDVRVQLKGGRITLETGVQLRRGVVLNVSGCLHIGEQAFLSWYSVVHCANEVRLGRWMFTGEGVTIVDSTHYLTAPDEWAASNVMAGRVVVGDNTWIAAKATISRNVTVGPHCIVAASAVVLEDVPPGHLAAGVPARSRPLELPWTITPADLRDPSQAPSSSS